MHAALASKFAIATSLARVAPAPNRVAERAPRTAVIECAHKKGTGSTKNGRDSNPKYLGVKKYGEEKVQVGSIIVRQRGNTFHAGEGVGTGKDFTLYALRRARSSSRLARRRKSLSPSSTPSIVVDARMDNRRVRINVGRCTRRERPCARR